MQNLAVDFAQKQSKLSTLLQSNAFGTILQKVSPPGSRVLPSITTLLTLYCDTHLARAAVIAMFIQVQPLPCAHGKLALPHWNIQTCSHQRRLQATHALFANVACY